MTEAVSSDRVSSEPLLPPAGKDHVRHLRDVYISSTIRLHRARTEHVPVVEPMLNDLRARGFRYIPGEERTARWLVRQAMHEGQHHLGDIRRTSEAMATRK